MFGQEGDDSAHVINGMMFIHDSAYRLDGGELINDGVELLTHPNTGYGTFVQHGGTHTINGILNIAAQTDYYGGFGFYWLEGGILRAHAINLQKAHYPTWIDGTLDQYGGTKIITGGHSINNAGAFRMSGGGTCAVEGAVNNDGTFTVTGTTADIDGTFTNKGVYLSSGSDNRLVDLIVEESGYLVGGGDDRWFIQNHFVNNSQANILWDTGLSSLSFVSGEDNLHHFFLAAADQGGGWEGYTNNFGWGTLSIGEGQALHLFDGNTSNEGTALYLRVLLGADISGTDILNIDGNGVSIYYLAHLEENAIFDGQTFALAGGGHLIPSAIPIPGSLWLLASGLIGFLVMRRR
jgi:hypothetical protein